MSSFPNKTPLRIETMSFNSLLTSASVFSPFCVGSLEGNNVIRGDTNIRTILKITKPIHQAPIH